MKQVAQQCHQLGLGFSSNKFLKRTGVFNWCLESQVAQVFKISIDFNSPFHNNSRIDSYARQISDAAQTIGR